MEAEKKRHLELLRGTGRGGRAGKDAASGERPPPDDPRLVKYRKMLQMRVPEGAVHAKMRAEGSGLKLEGGGGGVARGSNVVKWLLAQALAGSREQAVTLAEAMRRHGLLQPTGRKGDRPFADGSARYRLAAA